jgi:hypothetical protein
MPPVSKVFEERNLPPSSVSLSTDTQIETEEELRTSIDQDLAIIATHGASPNEIASVASRLILLSTAYTESKGEKRRLLLQSLSLSQFAMMQNTEFANRIKSGEALWEACEVLDEDFMQPMFFWSTAVLYLFREGFTYPTQIIHSKWIRRASAVLDHMATIDREWNGGSVLFSKAIVKFAVPEAIGGDKEAAWELVNQAAAIEGDWMLSRWGRAVYFHAHARDKDAYIDDLTSVSETNPDLDGEQHFWRRYFKEDALRRLEDIDNEF